MTDNNAAPVLGQRVSTGLGWFSIGLGIPSLLAPRTLQRLIGLSDDDVTRGIVRGVGVQEIGVGTGLIRRAQPVGLQWSRVAGDLGHLALLGRALMSKQNDQRKVARTMVAVAGVTVIDLLASLRLTHEMNGASRAGAVKAKTAITVRKPAAEVYDFWRNFENLPDFMYHLESVEATGDRSHWVAKGPGGLSIEWDAQITEDSPNEVIAWRSLEGSKVPNWGSVRFTPAPAGQGTEILVEIEYAPPGGKVGAIVAKLFGEEPEQQIRDDLRRFKQVIETGEVVVSDGIPDGTRTQRQLHHNQRPAQPVSSKEK